MPDDYEDIDDGRPYGRLQAPTSPSQVYSIRIPVERLEELRRVAEMKGQAPSALMRSWVLERLGTETRHAKLDRQTIRLYPFAVDVVALRSTFVLGARSA